MASGGATPLSSISRTGTPSQGPGPSPLNPNAQPAQTKICVYCGAAAGRSPEHVQAAQDLAKVMAENNIALVYGGGTVGLMGEVAKTLVSLSGPDSVHGIIPEALVKYERDGTYSSTKTAEGYFIPEEEVYGRTTVVKDMHTRKHMMAQEVLQGGPGSGFIALSGGFGTMEELMETATWNQLGIHAKGVVVLNINGFYDGLFSWIKSSVEEGFVKPGNAGILVEAKSGAEAVKALKDYKVSEERYKLTWQQN